MPGDGRMYVVNCPNCCGEVVSDVIDLATEIDGQWECGYCGYNWTMSFVHFVRECTHCHQTFYTRNNLMSVCNDCLSERGDYD